MNYKRVLIKSLLTSIAGLSIAGIVPLCLNHKPINTCIVREGKKRHKHMIVYEPSPDVAHLISFAELVDLTKHLYTSQNEYWNKYMKQHEVLELRCNFSLILSKRTLTIVKSVKWRTRYDSWRWKVNYFCRTVYISLVPDDYGTIWWTTFVNKYSKKKIIWDMQQIEWDKLRKVLFNMPRLPKLPNLPKDKKFHMPEMKLECKPVKCCCTIDPVLGDCFCYTFICLGHCMRFTFECLALMK